MIKVFFERVNGREGDIISQNDFVNAKGRWHNRIYTTTRFPPNCRETGINVNGMIREKISQKRNKGEGKERVAHWVRNHDGGFVEGQGEGMAILRKDFLCEDVLMLRMYIVMLIML